jgi:serine phosphatase RsbU (regulator of sigma subunit)
VVDLFPGDLLVLYSDGLVEAANSNGDLFGEQRLRQVLERCAAGTTCEIKDAILKAVRSFIGPLPLNDDLTLMTVRFEPVAVENSSEGESIVEGTSVLAG